MSQASELERQMLDLINAERTSRGLNPVQLELRLNDSAEDHSSWMLHQDVFAHTGAGGSSAGQRMESAGFQFSGTWTWAENIAWQSTRGAPGLADDVADLHNSLMNSPGHRANILSPDVELVGIGIEQGNFDGWDAVMVTQNFARTSAPVELDNAAPTASADNRPDANVATEGDDSLSLSSAGSLQGLAGNDTLNGSSGSDDLGGGDGRDLLTGRGGDDALSGGSGRDTLSGNQGSDELQGGGGLDRLRGGGGRDSLDGGNGNDRLWGGKGRDTLDGGGGNDLLHGGGGGDTFIFGRGDDTVKDFDASAAGERIHLGAADGITDYADLMANHVAQTSGGLQITDADGDTMLLSGITAQRLQADDFLF